jgi:hypothetical protein
MEVTMVSRKNSNEKAQSRSVIRACGAILTVAVGVLANGIVTPAQNAIIYQLGPEASLGQMSEGPGKVSIPPNAVLSRLQLGKGEKDGPRWSNIGYRSIQSGVRQLELGEESMLPTTIAPFPFGIVEFHRQPISSWAPKNMVRGQKSRPTTAEEIQQAGTATR